MDKEKVLLRLDYQIISESLKEDLQRKLFTLQTDFFIVRDPNYQIEEYCPIIDLYYLTDFPKIEREEYRNLQCKIQRVSIGGIIEEVDWWLAQEDFN